MGSLWKALDEEIVCYVALRLLLFSNLISLSYWLLKQVMIMKQLDHPNIVKLIEVIDDPQSDNYYMGISTIFWISKAFYTPTFTWEPCRPSQVIEFTSLM